MGLEIPEKVEESGAPGAVPGDATERYVEELNHFVTFKTGLTGASTAEVDEAIKIPPQQIEDAFVNGWDRHQNIETNRDHEALRRQAYNLSFGRDEKQRIRDSLPADTDVLDVIEAFGKKILLENFVRYLGRRRKYFRQLSFWAPLASVLLAGTVALALLWLVRSPPWPVWLAVAVPALGFAAVYTAAALVLRSRLWAMLIEDKLLKEREFYAEVVMGSTSRVKNYLSSIQRSFVSLSVGAQSQLIDLKTREDDFVAAAKRYVRLIVWFPVRLSMIEVFYRATVDEYLELSAEHVLAADMGIFARRQLRWFAIVSASLSMVCAAVAAVLAANADHDIRVAGLWIAALPIAIALGGLGAILWPKRETWSSAYFIPKEFGGFQFDVFHRRALGLLNGAVPAAVAGVWHLAVTWGVWPAGWVTVPEPTLLSLVLLASAGVICVCVLQNAIAHRLYLRSDTRKRYNGNIVDTIKEEMNSADWKAFNDLRSDNRMAEIYHSVFSALQDEKKKRH